ncbi:globin-like isoform X2 [Cylas formicarius]|uniref:globin-like isoform X2 n=1 Tax=Cylas formicarius TaxID=197179 RepID=UPI002958665B|nr:globin-like isoform X2 [Cylas formicarius]XP_060521334.1 globin-like isoform X2 [Cylas formicarius]XP_060521335.1 globin-like isoform X2 [Cylas formicarius]XP_060521336.1 globin-like isoform X2 [Cylas formicarius]XP_060521337.1 globin-like isoform X2 [Cylas formicarius]
MGIVYGYFFPDTGRTDDPDAVTGLTSRDKYLVKTSWANVMKNPTANGCALLLLLFKKYPEYIQLFPFRDVPYSELREAKRFQAHCNSVVFALASIVDALGDNDLLIHLLRKTGSSHVARKVTPEAFHRLKNCVVELFSTFMNEEEIAAWTKTLDVAFAQIDEGIKNAK